MRRARVLGMAALVAALALGGCGGGKSEVQLLKSARAAVQRQDYKAAVIQLKNALQANPKSAEARFLLGQSLLAEDDAAGAEAELRRALDLDYPAQSVAPLMAKALLATAKYTEVIDQYGTLELSDPKAAADVLVSVAQAHAAKRQFDEARRALDRAQGLQPDAPAVPVERLRLQMTQQDFDGALQSSAQLVQQQPSNARAWLMRANLLMQVQHDRDGAEKAYAKAAELEPGLAMAHAGLISILLDRKETEAARHQLDVMNKALPDHPQARFLEAQFAYAAGEFKRARELLQPLLQAEPGNVPVLTLAGAIEMKLGALPQAENLLATALKAGPRFPHARRLLAQLYLTTHQPAKALATLGPMLEQPSVDPAVLSAAAQAQLQLGDAKAADQLFTRAASLEPGDSKVRAAIAIRELTKGGGEAALNQLQAIAAEDQGTAVDMAVITARLQRSDLAGALKAIDAMEAKQPDSPVAATLRGRVLLQRKDAAGARKAFEAALARDPRYLPAATRLAALDLFDNKPSAAQGRFEAVLKVDPKNSQAMLELAELKRRVGATPEQVRKQIEAAIVANPADPTVRLALIDFHLAQRDFKSAVTAAQAAVAAQPSRIELLDRLGRAQLAAGDAEQATAAFNKIVTLQAESPLGPVGLAEVALAKKDLDAAAKHIQRAMELAPRALPVVRLGIAVALQRQRPEEALALARGVQTQWPNDAPGYVLEAEIESQRQNWSAAEAALRQATSKPDPERSQVGLHQILLKAGKDAEAARFAETWRTRHPKDALFLAYLAELALTQGQLPLADRRYQDLLKLQPDNAPALNNMAWLMTRQRRAGAAAYAERAVHAAPGVPAFMDTWAMALAAENQLPRALELQTEVVAKAPESGVYRLNLAKLYLQSGDKAKARRELERLAKLEPPFAGQDEVPGLLERAGDR